MKHKLPIILGILILITLFIGLFIYFETSIESIKYVNFDYKIKGQQDIGFNADIDALHFGTIPPGGKGLRDLIISSNSTVQVLIKVIGSEYVYPDKNNFVLEANRSLGLGFTAFPPLDAKQGNYSGKIRLIFKRV